MALSYLLQPSIPGKPAGRWISPCLLLNLRLRSAVLHLLPLFPGRLAGKSASPCLQSNLLMLIFSQILFLLPHPLPQLSQHHRRWRRVKESLLSSSPLNLRFPSAVLHLLLHFPGRLTGKSTSRCLQSKRLMVMSQMLSLPPHPLPQPSQHHRQLRQRCRIKKSMLS